MKLRTKENDKLFLKLFIVTLFMIVLAFTLLTIFTSSSQRIYKNILLIIFGLLIIILIFIVLGMLLLFFSKPNKQTDSLFLNWMKLSFKTFYPFIYLVSSVIGIEKNRVRGLYTQINNYLVSKKQVQIEADEILLLTPHCIQWAQCPHKITNDLSNCKLCGKCQVKDLIGLSQKYETPLSIVTGGTLARQNVAQKKPKAIVAIACERDLFSGIQDVKYIPILGVVNERPEGPCYNTRIDISKVEEAILYFLKGGQK